MVFGKFSRSLLIKLLVRELRMMDKRISKSNSNHAERVRRRPRRLKNSMKFLKNSLEIIIKIIKNSRKR
jgi:hypothetical protein